MTRRETLIADAAAASGVYKMVVERARRDVVESQTEMEQAIKRAATYCTPDELARWCSMPVERIDEILALRTGLE